MFNKEINEGTKKVIIKGKLFKDGDLLVTDSFADMMSTYHNNKAMLEEADYQDQVTSYFYRKFENSIKKQYNPIIEKLYNTGIVVINKIEYNLKDFYIVFNDSKNNFCLRCAYDIFNNQELDYNKAVKFIDTTAFIRLINENLVIDDKIIIDSIEILNKTIREWDGYLHSETKETDSILNKKMTKDDVNG